MALNEARAWLIGYDIAEPKRLKKIHEYLKKIAIPVQYSLFFTESSARDIDKLSKVLAAAINPKHDDIRIYLLPLHTDIVYYGKRILPEGLLLLEANPNLASWSLLRK